MTAPPRIFDRHLIETRRRRAVALSTKGSDFLHRHAVDDIMDRLGAVKRRFPIALDIDSQLPLMADRLIAENHSDRVVRIGQRPDALAGDRHLAVIADEELLPFAAGSIDLAVSVVALQFVDDLPGALGQIRRALKPDGLFMAALLGGETLNELRTAFTAAEAELLGGAAPRVAPFAEVRSLGALLQRAGFALPVVDQDRLTVRYADPFALMRDLRAMGASNALVERSRRPLRRDVLFRTAAIYRDRFADPDGRIRATFDLIFLSGWAPDPSQQQPLAPGSAKVRLAEALGTQERLLREKDPEP
jgi:SAM-dependent methyltransferase